ncbi:MAG TPA: 16S rRNA (guanine(527)-N(7))-methyltransferase RsmG [Pyrinomonadaceae bacterium]
MNNVEATEKLKNALSRKMREYAIDLSSETIEQLSVYYTLLTRWNDRLHLVAPCSPEEFAQRHILESLVLLRFFSAGASVVDVGSGGGLPIIPCLIARPDLNATLIESSPKKSVFLREALGQLGVSRQAMIVAKSFADTTAPDVQFVTCRALDEFMSKVEGLVKWSPLKATMLLFGGETLRQNLEFLELRYTEYLLPLSEKRFLFEVNQHDIGS